MGADALAEGDEAHASEVEATWRRLRREQLATQHHREMQALLTRCTCQRDDLEKQLIQVLERHDRRCSAVVAVRPALPGLALRFITHTALAGSGCEGGWHSLSAACTDGIGQQRQRVLVMDLAGDMLWNARDFADVW